MEIPDGAGVRVRLSMGFPGRPVQRAQGVAPGVWAAAICSWGPQPPLDLVKMSSAHPTQLLPSQWRDGLEAKATGPCRSEGWGLWPWAPHRAISARSWVPGELACRALAPAPCILLTCSNALLQEAFSDASLYPPPPPQQLRGQRAEGGGSSGKGLMCLPSFLSDVY